MANKLYGSLKTKANLVGSLGAGAIQVMINDHNQLENRDLDDQHPINAITGLQDILDTIPEKTSDITNDGDGQSPFATQEYVEQNGGKIDVIELNGVEQEIVEKKVSLDVDKQTVGLGNVDNTSDLNKPISTATQNALDGKVDKVNGKGLSTNDYTDEEKLKLSGIETGAEVNSIESISAGGTQLTIDASKNVDIPYATNSGNAGVVKIDTSYGISIGSLNQLQMQKADDNNITTRNANFRAIVPTNLNFAVKSALSDTNHLTMTSEEQTTAQQVLGVTDELNNKLDKITTSGLNRVYSITSEGQQGVFNVDDGLSNWSLARRNGSGNVKVATTPTNNNDATSKQYVDGQISNTVAIAEGKTASYTISDVINPDFNSNNDTITLAVSGTITDIESKVISLSSLKIGDIILVTGTQLPDRWVGSIDSTNVVFYKMETSKVDLDNYYTKTQTDTLLDGKISSVSAGGTALTPDADKNVDIPLAHSSGNNNGLINGYQNAAVGGISVNNGNLSLIPAPDVRVTARASGAITPANLNFAVKSALSDANHLTMTSQEQTTAQEVLGLNVLTGTSAPTSATIGNLWQLYVDTSNNKTYQCTAVNEDTSTTPSTYTYTWTQMVRVDDLKIIEINNAPTTSTKADYIGQLCKSFYSSTNSYCWFQCVGINNGSYTWKRVYLEASTNGIAIGNDKDLAHGGIAIGQSQSVSAGQSGRWSTAIGFGAWVGAQFGTALGGNGAHVGTNATNAIQLGTGTNNTANTFQVFTYQLLDANGKVPQERLPEGFVSYEEQSLTEEQKTQARTNIGAGTGTVKTISVGGGSATSPDVNGNIAIPVAGNSVKGVVDVRAFFGNEVDAYGRLSTVKASNQEIDEKTNIYKAIVPSNYTYAVSKTYLKGSEAPTTSTVAEFEGQLYLDTTKNNTYQCVAITTSNDTTTYTWNLVLKDTNISNLYGVGLDSGKLCTVGASDAEIDARVHVYHSITPAHLNYAVKAALTDTNHLTMTSEEQTTAQSVIGVSRGIARLV